MNKSITKEGLETTAKGLLARGYIEDIRFLDKLDECHYSEFMICLLGEEFMVLEKALKLTLEILGDKALDAYKLDDLLLCESLKNVKVIWIQYSKHILNTFGYYSYMRLEEISQLYIKDIYEENGIWVFNINTKLDYINGIK